MPPGPPVVILISQRVDFFILSFVDSAFCVFFLSKKVKTNVFWALGKQFKGGTLVFEQFTAVYQRDEHRSSGQVSI